MVDPVLELDLNLVEGLGLDIDSASLLVIRWSDPKRGLREATVPTHSDKTRVRIELRPHLVVESIEQSGSDDVDDRIEVLTVIPLGDVREIGVHKDSSTLLSPEPPVKWGRVPWSPARLLRSEA